MTDKNEPNVDDIQDVETEEQGFAVMKSAMDSILNSEQSDKTEDEEIDESLVEESVNEVEEDRDEELELDQDEEEETTSEDKSEELTIDDIDSDLVSSARKRGWEDDRILKYATEDPDVLVELHKLMSFTMTSKEDDSQEEAEEEVEEVKKIEYTKEAIEKLDELYGEGYYDSVLKPIVESHNMMAEQLHKNNQTIGTIQKESSEKIKNNEDKVFNDYLDKSAKDFPVFGNWSKVPMMPDGSVDVSSDMVKARVEVWKAAKAFKAQGMSMDDAAKEAVTWYKGRHLEKEVQKKVVNDLNKRKKKFTPRPTSKKVTRKFKTQKEEGLNIISEAKKSVGLVED